jgi:hypothetical protein
MMVDELVERLNEMSARQIVRWLTTPAQSGFYLSSEDLARASAAVGVRVSPFSRSGALEQLLRGAALDDRLPQVLGELREEMSRQLASYEQLSLPEVARWIEQGELTLAAWSAIEAGFTSDSHEASGSS